MRIERVDPVAIRRRLVARNVGHVFAALALGRTADFFDRIERGASAAIFIAGAYIACRGTRSRRRRVHPMAIAISRTIGRNRAPSPDLQHALGEDRACATGCAYPPSCT